jgi:hypothetical protein
MHYRICIRGHLDPSWQERFAGLRLELQEAGTTLLSGELPDQAALHGNPYRGRGWPCSSPHSCWRRHRQRRAVHSGHGHLDANRQHEHRSYRRDGDAAAEWPGAGRRGV